jgi:hypothetical protein
METWEQENVSNKDFKQMLILAQFIFNGYLILR